MNCEISTAPVLPPPGPGVSPPGFVVFGPGCSLQQALASLDSASSNVTTIMAPSAYAGEDSIRGTQVWRNASALRSPPGSPSTHGASCPSWQRLGVMNV